MTALNFPLTPTDGQLYPPGAGEPGKLQWKYNESSDTWEIVPPFIRTGGQGSFNGYEWPSEAPAGSNYSFLVNASGGIEFKAPHVPSFQNLGLLEEFDGVKVEFTLVEEGTTDPYVPVPSNNIVVFVGGVPQSEGSSYSVVGDTITFSEAPPAGASFFAISTISAPIG
jgi:hypothetical protein